MRAAKQASAPSRRLCPCALQCPATAWQCLPPARLAPQLCRGRRCRRACAQVLRAAAKDESTATLLREGSLPLSCVPVWLPPLFCCTLKPCRASQLVVAPRNEPWLLQSQLSEAVLTPGVPRSPRWRAERARGRVHGGLCVLERAPGHPERRGALAHPGPCDESQQPLRAAARPQGRRQRLGAAL